MIKMKSLSLALVCIIALSAFTACVKSPLLPTDGSSSTPSSQSPINSKPAGYYEGDTKVELATVLTVGDYEVSFDEFRYAYMNIAAQLAATGEVDEASLKEQCLAFFKDRAAMRSISLKNNITLTDEDMKLINDDIAAQRTSAGSDETYNATLAQNYLNDDVLISMAESQRFFEKYVEFVASTTHKEEILKNITENYAHVKHVLISFPDDKKLADATEAEIKTTLDKANEAVKKITDGMSFEDAIKEYNQDTGQPDDGYTFTSGEMVKSFEDKSFELTVGEMSEPVQSEFGYHIIKKYELSTSEIKDSELKQYATEEVQQAIIDGVVTEAEAFEVKYCKEWDKITSKNIF